MPMDIGDYLILEDGSRAQLASFFVRAADLGAYKAIFHDIQPPEVGSPARFEGYHTREEKIIHLEVVDVNVNGSQVIVKAATPGYDLPLDWV